MKEEARENEVVTFEGRERNPRRDDLTLPNPKLSLLRVCGTHHALHLISISSSLCYCLTTLHFSTYLLYCHTHLSIYFDHAISIFIVTIVIINFRLLLHYLAIFRFILLISVLLTFFFLNGNRKNRIVTFGG